MTKVSVACIRRRMQLDTHSTHVVSLCTCDRQTDRQTRSCWLAVLRTSTATQPTHVISRRVQRLRIDQGWGGQTAQSDRLQSVSDQSWHLKTYLCLSYTLSPLVAVLWSSVISRPSGNGLCFCAVSVLFSSQWTSVVPQPITTKFAHKLRVGSSLKTYFRNLKKIYFPKALLGVHTLQLSVPR